MMEGFLIFRHGKQLEDNTIKDRFMVLTFSIAFSIHSSHK